MRVAAMSAEALSISAFQKTSASLDRIITMLRACLRCPASLSAPPHPEDLDMPDATFAHPDLTNPDRSRLRGVIGA